MSKLAIVIGVLALAGFTGAYFTNNKAKAFIDREIFEVASPPAKTVPVPEHNVYFVADGTYSGNTTYNIPKISIENINEVLDGLFETGGKFWLTYVDNDSRNNPVRYFAVEKKIQKEAEPVHLNNESSFTFSDRKKAWKERTKDFEVKQAEQKKAFEDKKENFLKDCDTMLRTQVYVKRKENEWTDLIGVLNAAFITLSAKSEVPAKKYLVCYSDMEQDTPFLKPQPKLAQKEKDIQILAVNPIQGSSKKLTKDLLEIEHPDKVSEIIFRK